MAIETCYIYNNTSILHDELLAHRLGLIPIFADPRKFQYVSHEHELTELNHIVFTLNVKCERNPQAPPGATDPDEKYLRSKG